MTSSKNSRPWMGRSKTCVRLTSIWVDVDLAPVEAKPRRAATARRSLSSARPLLEHAESPDHLLRDADHDHTFVALEAGQVLAGDVFFALAELEVDDGDLVALGEVLDVVDEAVGDLLEEGRGDNRVLAVLVQEPPEIFGSLKQRHVAVEVQAVDAVDLDGDVVAQ